MKGEKGLALPAVLILMLLMASVCAVLSSVSMHNLKSVQIHNATETNYLAAEGVVNKLVGEISSLGTLWEQQVPLNVKPSAYSEYSPTTFVSSNGIPPCSGISCQRHLYPTGGGLLKNVSPAGVLSSSVDTAYPISEQIDFQSLPEADLMLSDQSAWVQVERLEEIRIQDSMLGASLSNGLAEGGNAKNVRFRITGYSLKAVKGRLGLSTIVAIVELPAT